MKVGYHFFQEHSTVAELRQLWRDAEALGVDSLWPMDHFVPINGDPRGTSFDGWTLLAAMACETERAQIGVLVSGSPYRNPDLLADMARTVDHLSGGRAVLGVGAGWYERDFAEYGYPFESTAERMQSFEQALQRIRARLPRLNPAPVGRLPLLIGGAGEKVMLRLVAEHADMWNTFGPLETWAQKNAALDAWCHRVGRDPAEIERTVFLGDDEVGRLEEYVAAGAQQVIVAGGSPFDLTVLRQVLRAARDLS